MVITALYPRLQTLIDATAERFFDIIIICRFAFLAAMWMWDDWGRDGDQTASNAPNEVLIPTVESQPQNSSFVPIKKIIIANEQSNSDNRYFRQHCLSFYSQAISHQQLK